MPLGWLEPVAEVLDSRGARWALIGALAALRYRHEPRLTNDLDLLVEPVPGLGDAFRSRGFSVREVADEDEPPHLVLVRGKGVRADLLLATVEYQRLALDRAADGVITVEDVLVHKLIAWRERDRDDVLSILRGSQVVDDDYVRHWAAAWEVSERWDEARRSR